MEEKEEKKENKKVDNTKKSTETKKDTKTTDTKKKFNNAKEEKKKPNTIITTIITIVVALVVAIVAYMIVTADSPKKAVNDTFKEAKTILAEQNILANLVDEEESTKELQEAISSNLSWKILSQKEEGDNVAVEVEVTNKDFGAIITKLQQEMFKAKLNNEEMTDENLIEKINSDEIENVTNTHTIIVEKKDGKWEVSEETDIIDIILPGFNQAIEELN